MKEYLFGYGSIRTDLKWYGRVPLCYLKPVGFGTINFPLYRMKVWEGSWAAVKFDEEGETYGQLFEIKSELKKEAMNYFDYREVTSRFFSRPNYFRKLIDVTLTTGTVVKAWVYFGHPNVQFIKKIETGNWYDEIFFPGIPNKICAAI